MAKRAKTVKKTVTITEISAKKTKKIPREDDHSKDKTNKLLLENFIALQEALTNLGYELKDLNKKISSMLEIFETAAKNFQEKPESRNLSSKLNEIIEQNKTIAKSLLLMHKTTKEKFSKNEGLESFKPSIKNSEDEDSEESAEKDSSKESEEISIESDETGKKSAEELEEFKPEPLPEFNF